jgi:hypothetical protein
MFITVVYKTQNGESFTLAEGDGFLPIPNVGDQFSYKDGPFTVKARCHTSAQGIPVDRVGQPSPVPARSAV